MTKCFGRLPVSRVGTKISMIYINDIYHDIIMIFSSENIMIFIIENINLFSLRFLLYCYGQTRPTASACMTSSSSGSGTDQTATNIKRATAVKWRLNGISFKQQEGEDCYFSFT